MFYLLMSAVHALDRDSFDDSTISAFAFDAFRLFTRHLFGFLQSLHNYSQFGLEVSNGLHKTLIVFKSSTATIKHVDFVDVCAQGIAGEFVGLLKNFDQSGFG